MTQREEQDVRRVLVVNGKGGCGKTTIATNLSVAYHQRGNTVALVDQDQQGSSAAWHAERSQHTSDVHLVSAFRREKMYQTKTFHNRMPSAVDRVVIDTTSVGHTHDLELLIKSADVILVPMMASAIDLRVSTRFLTDLLTHRAFRARPRAVGAVLNRVNSERGVPEPLTNFLRCADVPHVATFHDHAGYTDAADTGRGILELTAELASDSTLDADASAWSALCNWIDAQPSCNRVTVAALRQRPRSAPRHQETQSDSGSAARA